MLYPKFDKDIINASTKSSRIEYMMPIIKEIYKDKHEELIQKTIEYQKFWDEHEYKIQAGLESVFGVSLEYIFDDIEARVGINPVGPRYLENNAFDAFHLYSPSGMAVNSIHEIIHFIWFYVWKINSNDDIIEYENPHLKCVFSEMVVDLIIRKANLSYMNPDNHETIYPYFHDIIVDGEELLNLLELLLYKTSIVEFMKKGYELCEKYEGLIRGVMY